MTGEGDLGGEAPCWAHLVDDVDQPVEPLAVLRSNTIIYCEAWSEVVAFYRHALALRTTMCRDWFVEFELGPGAHLSVADSARATVAAGTGSGLTLSLNVVDLDATRAQLIERGVEPTTPRTRWGARYFYVFDPGGNRIEFWSELPSR